MTNHKVIAVTPFYGRPEVSRIFCEQLKEIGIPLIAVTHYGDSNIKLLKEYAQELILTHHNITGKKWNEGLKALKHLDFDYVIILGSDDLISERYFTDFANAQMDKGKRYIGLLDAVALDLRVKRFRYWGGYRNQRRGESLGCGRLIHKSVLQVFNYQIFPEVQGGSIDYHSNMNIQSVTGYGSFIYSLKKPYRLGLKSGHELTYKNSRDFRLNLSLEGFYSDRIIQMIRSYK